MRLRVEDEGFLRGDTRFLRDLPVDDCLHASFVRSTVAHGRLLGVDATAARRAIPTTPARTCARFSRKFCASMSISARPTNPTPFPPTIRSLREILHPPG